ncbi:MAG: hypothetical protein JAY67_17000 [Candidatus Thiodiazotropha taylori]|nr:hypothetical protein [Candidatus Thiodiazotropha taylori]
MIHQIPVIAEPAKIYPQRFNCRKRKLAANGRESPQRLANDYHQSQLNERHRASRFSSSVHATVPGPY